MSFLRRFLGGADPQAEEPAASDPAAVDAAEEAENLVLLRAEEARMDDFRRRQLRYARWAWRPPAQGGERRADDADGEGIAGDH